MPCCTIQAYRTYSLQTSLPFFNHNTIKRNYTFLAVNMTRTRDQTLLSDDCLFPTKATKGQRAQWRSQEIAPALVKESIQFCQKANVQLSFLLATAWAVILRRYAEVDQVHFGTLRFTHTDDTSVGMAYKPRMILMSTSMARVGSVRELFVPEHWTMSSPDPNRLHTFNSGLVICDKVINQINSSEEWTSEEEVCHQTACWGVRSSPFLEDLQYCSHPTVRAG